MGNVTKTAAKTQEQIFRHLQDFKENRNRFVQRYHVTDLAGSIERGSFCQPFAYASSVTPTAKGHKYVLSQMP